MYIYNVTVNVDADIHDEWFLYMKETHIPDVMNTGCFTKNQMVKVLNVNDEGFTYSIQYYFNTMEDITRYQKEHAPRLQLEVKEKYADKFAAFRTLLEIV